MNNLPAPLLILLFLHGANPNSCGNLITNLDATVTINSSTAVDTQIFTLASSSESAYPFVLATSSDYFELQGDDEQLVQTTDCLSARSTHYLTIESQNINSSCPADTGILTVEVEGTEPQFNLTYSNLTIVVTGSDVTAGSINVQEFSIANEGKCTEFQCDATSTNSDQIFSITTDTRTSIIICEGDTETLSCAEPGTLIDITSAVYGRTSDQVCIHRSMSDLNCRKENGTDLPLVLAACDGRASCDMKADNRVFEDPCKGTYKYLDITFDCKPGSLFISASVSDITYNFVYHLDVTCYDRNAKYATSITDSFDVMFIDYLTSTTSTTAITTTTTPTTTTTTPTTTTTTSTTTTTTPTTTTATPTTTTTTRTTTTTTPYTTTTTSTTTTTTPTTTTSTPSTTTTMPTTTTTTPTTTSTTLTTTATTPTTTSTMPTSPTTTPTTTTTVQTTTLTTPTTTKVTPSTTTTTPTTTNTPTTFMTTRAPTLTPATHTPTSTTTGADNLDDTIGVENRVEGQGVDQTLIIAAALSSVGGASLIGLTGMLIYRATNICRIPKAGLRRNSHDEEDADEEEEEEYYDQSVNTGNESPASVSQRAILIGSALPGPRMTPVEIDDPWYNLYDLPNQT